MPNWTFIIHLKHIYGHWVSEWVEFNAPPDTMYVVSVVVLVINVTLTTDIITIVILIIICRQFLSNLSRRLANASIHMDMRYSLCSNGFLCNVSIRFCCCTTVLLMTTGQSRPTISTLWVKKQEDTLLMLTTFRNIDRFSKFFHCYTQDKML